MRTASSFFFLLAFAGALAIFSSTLAKTPVLPLFAQALGASPWQIGWIVMASTIPGILISFPAGVLADRFGQRRLLLASMLIFASAPWLYLVVHDAWSLAAVRFYHGFATAIFGTVASATIARNFSADRATRLSTFSSVTIVGRSIAPFLGGALLSFASIDSVYLVCALSGALALAAGFGLRIPESPAQVGVDAHPGLRLALRAVLADRRIVVVSLTEAAQYLSFGAVEAFLALYAAKHGLPAWQIGVILGAQLISIIFVKPLMGGISDRVGRGRVILPGLLLGAVSLLLLPFAGNFPAMTLISVLYGIGFATATSIERS